MGVRAGWKSWRARRAAAKQPSDVGAKDSQRLLGVVAGVAGGLLMWLSEHDDMPRSASTLLNQLGGLLIVAVAFGWFWELRGRAIFTRDLLSKVNLSQEIASSGVVSITDVYLQSVPWATYITGARTIEISMAYGSTWRKMNDEAFKLFFARADARITILLPDPRDPAAVREMARRFACTTAEVQDNILATARAFLEYAAAGAGTMDLRWRAGIPTFTYYRFDKRVVITLYSNRRARTGDVPTIQVEGGRLGKFLRDDWLAMIEQSEAVELSVVTAKIRRIKGRA